jgi:putative DNA methylase
MVWDYAEVNSFSGSSGNFYDNIEWVAQATESIKFSGSAISYSSSAVQKDATTLTLDGRIVVSTDPPYYDNIGYADLSDFFYVWMRKSLRDVYPDIFGTMLVPKEPELIASPSRHGSKEAANAHFENGLHQTFGNIRRFISHDYPLTVYYAFKQQDAETGTDDDYPDDEVSQVSTKPAVSSTGWETMLTSLIDSGFSIDGTWPMRTERGSRTIGIGSNALASSIILVCRPRPENAATISRRGFVDTLRRELPAALKEMQSGNIAPVDLAQASIGPGMAIYSRYSKVLEADGSPMSVRTALGLINQELDAYLAEQDGDIDADTRFAVSWFEQFGFNEGEFGQADVLARAKNTSVAGVEAAGLVLSGRGKVRLLHWKEYDLSSWDPQQDKRPTVWEATHHLIKRLNSHGETGSAMLMTKMPPDMAAEARNLAYRLYSICERKGWADHARDYNALVISWAGIGEETARLRDAEASGDATTQMSMFGDEE